MGGLIKYLILSSWLLWTPVLSAPTTTSKSKPTAGPSPTFSSNHESGGEEHIVIVDKNAPIPPRVAEVLKRLDLDENHPDVRHVFNNSAFQGFAASMKSHCLDLLANMSDVSMVEKAATVSRSSVLTLDVRPNAPWGLQRISTSSSVTGSAQAINYKYTFKDTSLGAGADVYIVDTGVYTEHNIFGGRAKMVWSLDGDMTDADGHGTHVAGTATGDTLGVASNANIFGVKALDADGGGWSSNVVAAIDFVIQNHDARKASNPATFLGSVISMSLASSEPVSAISAAVEAAISAGIHSVVAAGNNAADACQSSPASSGGTHGGAITVGAIDMSTSRASFSNYGDCVDVYAPGVDVISSWIGAPNMINILSGTSMATPHVTGIVAYAMANRTLAGSPGLMKEWIRMAALPLGDGTLLANNGVQAGADGEGVLGLVARGGEGVTVSKVEEFVKRAVEWRWVYSRLDSSMRCERASALGTWLCTAKKAVDHLTSVMHT